MILSNTQLFGGINENDIKNLLVCVGARQKKYKKGETIFSDGEITQHIGLILSGMAIVVYADVWGNNSVLGNVTEGEVFAEPYACLKNEPLLVNIIAAKDAEVMFINASRVLGMCNNICQFHAKLIRNLLTVCAAKNLQLSRRIMHTASKSIRGRLLSYFSECAKKALSSSFDIPYNRQQLADYLSVDRSAMCNELSKMQKDGLIKYSGNNFEIIN